MGSFAGCILAMVFAFIWGGKSFGAGTLFALLGSFVYGKVSGVSVFRRALPSFVLTLLLGAIGELTAHFTEEAGRHIVSWWLYFSAVLLTFLSPGIRGEGRKLRSILYLSALMLFHMYAESGGEGTPYYLSLEGASLFVGAYSFFFHRKQKNDA